MDEDDDDDSVMLWAARRLSLDAHKKPIYETKMDPCMTSARFDVLIIMRWWNMSRLVCMTSSKEENQKLIHYRKGSSFYRWGCRKVAEGSNVLGPELMFAIRDKVFPNRSGQTSLAALLQQ